MINDAASSYSYFRFHHHFRLNAPNCLEATFKSWQICTSKHFRSLYSLFAQNKLVLTESSPLKFMIQLATLVCVWLNMVFLPLVICYNLEDTYKKELYLPTLCVFAIHLLANFFTSYYEKGQVRHPSCASFPLPSFPPSLLHSCRTRLRRSRSMPCPPASAAASIHILD